VFVLATSAHPDIPLYSENGYFPHPVHDLFSVFIFGLRCLGHDGFFSRGLLSSPRWSSLSETIFQKALEILTVEHYELNPEQIYEQVFYCFASSAIPFTRGVAHVFNKNELRQVCVLFSFILSFLDFRSRV
jgi:hypothetical protein